MAKKKNRASNGMGSIRQRSDGRWEARYTTPDGRQHSVYAKTEKEVTAKLRGELHNLDSGIWSAPSRMTVEEWMQVWLTDYQTHTAPSTQKTYSDTVRIYVLPVIGALHMSKVLPMHIRRVIATMQDKGRSPTYIRQCRAIMSVAFGAAVSAGVIKSNPVKDIKTPRIPQKQLNIVDREMIPAFIEAAREVPNGLALIFDLLTGLRAGELRGLKWDDIDFTSGEMAVKRQLQRVTDGNNFTPPKDGSTRTIQLPPEAIAILREQRRHQAEQTLAAGPRWPSNEIVNGLVFRTATGNPLNSTSLFESVRAVGQKLGLPQLHPHDLRHSYAVAALRSGVDVKTVQHNLGHSSAAMTLDVYAAYTTDAGKVGAEKLSEYWQKALKNT